MKTNVAAVSQFYKGRKAMVLTELDKKQNRHKPPFAPHVTIHTINRTINGMTPEYYEDYIGWAKATGKVVEDAVEHTTYEGCNIALPLYADCDVLEPVIKEMDAKLASHYPYTALRISMELPLEHLYLVYDVDYDSQVGIAEHVLDKFDFLDKTNVLQCIEHTEDEGQTEKFYLLGSLVERLTNDLENHVIGKFGNYEIDMFGDPQLSDEALVEYKKIHRDVHYNLLEATGFSVDLAPWRDME